MNKSIIKIFLVFFSSYLIFSGSFSLVVKLTKSCVNVVMLDDNEDESIPEKESEDCKEEDSKEKDEEKLGNDVSNFRITNLLLIANQKPRFTNLSYFNSVLIEIIPRPPEA